MYNKNKPKLMFLLGDYLNIYMIFLYGKTEVVLLIGKIYVQKNND